MRPIPAGPPVRFAVAITGHRRGNRTPAANATRIAAALAGILGEIEAALAAEPATAPALTIHPPRLHTLLAHGVDQLAASEASSLGWEIVAPLPFGREPNVAINAQPRTHSDGMALLAWGDAFNPAGQAGARGIRQWSDRARLFQLADRDNGIAALFEAMLAAPADDASQRAYHHAKAKRLETISHRLDRLAATLFKTAVAWVALWLPMRAGAALQRLPHAWPHSGSKAFAFLGVALPTLGASIAGICYFSDFERFAANFDFTACKLAQVEVRIGQLLAGPDAAIDHEGVSRLAKAIDGIVVDEIESWQAVFSGKPIALPA